MLGNVLMLGAKYYMMLVVCIILLYWKMEKGDYINQFAEFCGYECFEYFEKNRIEL